MVTNPKRGALLLHVWRISITKRLRKCVREMQAEQRKRLYVWAGPLMLFDLSPLNKANPWMTLLKGDLFLSHYYTLILKIVPSPPTPSLSAPFTAHHSSTPSHTNTHTYTTFTSLPPCPSPVSGQKWKDYRRGKGVPLSLEIGQVLCACSCLSLSRGPSTEQ